MLVLSRSKSQAVVMPELGIKVTILKTTGGRVKLGFEAPRNLRIIREEHHVQEESAPNLAETRGEPDCSDAGGQSVEPTGDMAHALPEKQQEGSFQGSGFARCQTFASWRLAR